MSDSNFGMKTEGVGNVVSGQLEFARIGRDECRLGEYNQVRQGLPSLTATSARRSAAIRQNGSDRVLFRGSQRCITSEKIKSCGKEIIKEMKIVKTVLSSLTRREEITKKRIAW
jgi:hypothetical protein